ncbi:hypothetical protein PV326_004850 [Microctonus aethiopoides]|nr:hypothetical protein PV326_004850 [Microctonus aethiopoides]
MSYNTSMLVPCSEFFLGPSLSQVCPGSQFFIFMTLLDTFVRAKSEISQLCERVQPIDPADYYYDFIIIGVLNHDDSDGTRHRYVDLYSIQTYSPTSSFEPLHPRGTS